MRIMGIDPGTNYMGYGVIEIVGNKPQALVMGFKGRLSADGNRAMSINV